MVQTKKRTTMRALKKSRNTKKTRGTRYNKRKHNRKPMGKKRRTRRTNKRMYGGSATDIFSSFGTNEGANTLGVVSGQTNNVLSNVYVQPIVNPTGVFV